MLAMMYKQNSDKKKIFLPYNAGTLLRYKWSIHQTE